MNLQETNAFLTWLSQHDGRISNAAPSVEIWQYALNGATVTEARQAILDHYRVNDTAANPDGIRKRAAALRETNIARTRAIEPPSRPAPKHPNGWRARNPELWDRLFEQGRAEGQAIRQQSTQAREAQTADAA